jgi:hypothetical protein
MLIRIAISQAAFDAIAAEHYRRSQWRALSAPLV